MNLSLISDGADLLETSTLARFTGIYWWLLIKKQGGNVAGEVP